MSILREMIFLLSDSRRRRGQLPDDEVLTKTIKQVFFLEFLMSLIPQFFTDYF